MMSDKIRDALAKADAEIAFLQGEGPLDGFHFGERPAARPPFWWRKLLTGIVTLRNRVPALLAELEAARAEIERLREAGQAVVDRWDTPAWKDAPPTADAINKLRAALASKETGHDA